MNLCDNGHEEICYEGRRCPFCAEQSEWEKERAELQRHLEEALGEASELAKQLAELEALEPVVRAIEKANSL